MQKNDQTFELEIIHVIVKFGLGSKILKIAKKHGVTGGTMCIGKGTISNKILNMLAITDTRKEVVMMIATKDIARETTKQLNKHFHFDKPNHGILFTTSLTSMVGARMLNKEEVEERGDEIVAYQNIVVIVDKGNAEDVIEAGKKAGSKGGTIINARGSGIHETSKLFSMNIEPEKEIVMILTNKDYTDPIIKSISEELKIDEPGNGVIFVQNINQTYGIYE